MYSNKIGSILMLSHNLTNIAKKSGFKLRDMENREIDWRAVGTIDINKLVDMQDFDMLLKLIPKIIEAPMHSALTSSLFDPSVSAVFRLSQLGLQYLSFCLQFMDHTLVDLKTAMHQLQKKNSTLKQNYKSLEEEHYKAKEQLEKFMYSDSPRHSDGTINTFGCKKCAKHFRSNELLEAHDKRRHQHSKTPATVAQDCESNAAKEMDDPKIETINKESKEKSNLKVAKSTENIAAESTEKDKTTESHNVESICSECEVRKQSSAAEASIQCNLDDSVRGALVGNRNNEETKDIKIKGKRDSVSTEDANPDSKLERKTTDSTVDRNENYENIISALREEMTTIINQFQHEKNEQNISTVNEQSATTHLNNQTERVLEQTNDKIDSIQERFTQFQDIFFQHQKEFAESFKNLDERQKYYVDHVNDMVKNLELRGPAENKQDLTRKVDPINDAKNVVSNDDDDDNEIIVAEMKITDEQMQKDNSKPEAPIKHNQSTSSDYSSSETSQDNTTDDESEESNIIVHPIPADHLTERDPAKLAKLLPKEIACEILDERLSEIGIKSDCTGLTDSKYDDVAKKLELKREKIEEENVSFKSIRNKLKIDLQNRAKSKLKSANNSPEEQHNSKTAKADDSILSKLILNDIDEGDLKNKISRAQSVLEAHRESIKTLLNTTAHTPNTIAMSTIKHAATSGGIAKGGENYSKSNKPANNTRRVVFVNLDEDS